MTPIGIMQGRLSPPVAKRLQAFPWGRWEQEFALAPECGIDAIEWLFEEERFEENPIWTGEGRAAIKERVAATGVRVDTLCGDYFMPRPFFRAPTAEVAKSVAVLNRLIEHLAAVGGRTILLPILEVAEIRAPSELGELQAALKEPLDAAARFGVRLGLEMELPGEEYRDIVESFAHPSLGVYYDTGNNASRGHDVAADIVPLADRLVGVHVKDRPKGGATVPLGEGACDFPGFFQRFARGGFDGTVVLQTAFGEDFKGIATRHARLVRDWMAT